MNNSLIDSGGFTTNRQGKSIGALLGFLLATLFPSLALGKLQNGSIKFQYDPTPLINQSNPPASINIYQQSPSSSTRPPEDTRIQQTESNLHFTKIPPHSPEVEQIFGSNNDKYYNEYLVPFVSESQKVKRAASSRYYRRNRYNIRRRNPEHFLDYDTYYDYPIIKSNKRNKKRTQMRRPTLIYDYDYDYDFNRGGGSTRNQQRKKNRNKPRRDPDYYSDEDVDDDIEPVTAVVKPRQQETTTTEMTTTQTTVITNGTVTTNASVTNAYGYGPNTGNDNISITYGPPSSLKPVYGVPGVSHGYPPVEWAPSNPYDSSISFNYSPTSHSYGNSGYAGSKPYPSYGPPSTTYGIPNQSYGVPSQSPSERAFIHNYQQPFSNWYGKGASHDDIVKRVHDALKTD